jgi:hypothetical protein
VKDGLYPAIPRAEYDHIERDSFSALKAISKSPAHYRHCLTTPPEDTDPKKVGRVVHLAAFEPERFRNRVAVWDGAARRGKDWEAFCERNQDKELLTLAEYEKCIAIQKAVRADPVAMQYVSKGRGEVSLLWKMQKGEGVNAYTIHAKGRIDFDAQAALVDLKTTKDAAPEAFGRQFFSLHYDAQSAWYQDGYLLATGERKPYVIVAVENVEPFVVQVYRVPGRALELGREKYQLWLDRLAWCRETSQWPGYSEYQELELSIPRWILPDDDISALGLEIDSKE